MVEGIPNCEERGKGLGDKVFLEDAASRTLDVLSMKEDVKNRIELGKIMEELDRCKGVLDGYPNGKLIREKVRGLEGKLAGYKSLFNAEIVKRLFENGCHSFVVNEVINNNDLNGYLPFDKKGNEYEWRLDEDLAVSLMIAGYSGSVVKKHELFEMSLSDMLDKLVELKQFWVIMDCIECFPNHQEVVCKIIKNGGGNSVGPRLSECKDLDIVEVVDLMIMEGGVYIGDVERYANDYIASLEKKGN